MHTKHYSEMIKKFQCKCKIVGFDSWRLNEDWSGRTKGRIEDLKSI